MANQPAIYEDGLRILRELLELQGPAISCDPIGLKDVVLISIDVENIQRVIQDDPANLNPDIEIGLAILDTRDLGTVAPTQVITTSLVDPLNILPKHQQNSFSGRPSSRPEQIYLPVLILSSRDLVAM